MRKKLRASRLLSGLLMVVTISVSAAIYQKVDSNGVVTFSDQSQQGSEKVKLPPVQQYTPASLPSAETTSTTATTTEAKDPPAHVAYTALSLDSPSSGQTFFLGGDASQSIVSISFTLTPALQKGDTLQVLLGPLDMSMTSNLDADKNASPRSETLKVVASTADPKSNTVSFNLSNIYRGSYAVQLQVIGEGAEVFVQSGTIQINVSQPTIHTQERVREEQAQLTEVNRGAYTVRYGVVATQRRS